MMSLWSSLTYERTCQGRFADQPANGRPATRCACDTRPRLHGIIKDPVSQVTSGFLLGR